MDECRDEDDGSEKGSCDGRKLQVVSDKVRAVVACPTLPLCHFVSSTQGRIAELFFFLVPVADPRQRIFDTKTLGFTAPYFFFVRVGLRKALFLIFSFLFHFQFYIYIFFFFFGIKFFPSLHA